MGWEIMSEKEEYLVSQILVTRGQFGKTFPSGQVNGEVFAEPSLKLTIGSDGEKESLSLVVFKILQEITGAYTYLYQVSGIGPSFKYFPYGDSPLQFFEKIRNFNQVFFVSQDFIEGCLLKPDENLLWVFGPRAVEFCREIRSL